VRNELKKPNEGQVLLRSDEDKLSGGFKIARMRERFNKGLTLRNR